MPDHTEHTQNTFVVRFWWEWQREGAEQTMGWRGRVKHVQSGEGASFYDMGEMIAFITQFIPLKMKSDTSPQDPLTEQKVEETRHSRTSASLPDGNRTERR